MSNSMELNQEVTISSAILVNHRSLIPQPRYKTTHWKQYNKALINRGSLSFWIDEEAIANAIVDEITQNAKVEVTCGSSAGSYKVQ